MAKSKGVMVSPAMLQEIESLLNRSGNEMEAGRVINAYKLNNQAWQYVWALCKQMKK